MDKRKPTQPDVAMPAEQEGLCVELFPRFPIRGGNRNNGANAGLAALNLNNARSNSNTNIGLRLSRLIWPEAGSSRAAFQRLQTDA